MRYFLRLFLFASYLISPNLYSQTIADEMDTVINKTLPHATIGILVKDAKTGETIYSKNADKLFSPASGIKLFTAAAALYHLKPDYRFLTTLSQKEQDFYITFSGSPALTTENLNDVLLSLKKNNINLIKGNIILDTSRFKSPYYAPGVSYDDLGWYYTAPDTAVILNENAVAYDFISSSKLGEPIEIKPKDAAKKLNIINQVITVSKEEEKEHCNLNIEIRKKNTLRLFGCLAQNKQAKEMKLAVPNPVFLVKQVIKEILNKNNITFEGTIIKGNQPRDVKLIASHESQPLEQLITHMLQESDNLYASSLTKELGYSLTKDGSNKQGIYAMKSVLSQHTHIDMKHIELADGIGTRYNLVTPEQMVILLTDIYTDKKMQAIFLNALPQAGVSGTLKDRMKKTNLEKNVFAKTGSMHDISSLSGYLLSPNADPVTFSILINGINTPIDVAKSLEEKILDIIERHNAKKQVVQD